MDIEYIKIFSKIAEGATFQQVADEMNLTQSTVSKIIQKLENELQNKLFTREHRTVFLTPYGRFFYENAKKLISDYDELMQYTSSYQHGNRLLSYIVGTEMPFHIMDISIRFQSKYPNIAFSMERCTNLNKISKKLLSGEIDFAILHKPYESPKKLMLYELAKDPLYVILPLNHPLASEESININQIRQEYILMSEYISSYTSDIFKEYAVKPHISPTMQGSRRTIITNQVEQGHGISIFFKSDIDTIGTSYKIVKKPLIGVKEMPLVFATNDHSPSKISLEYKDFLIKEIHLQNHNNN